MPPLVTAVITTHSRPESVYEALASVCAETYAAVEVIVVDDGGTFELPPAGPSDRQVRVVRSDQGGVARARNAGVAASHGEFIIFLDDDDVALPHRIATLVDAAERANADFCFGMTRRVVANAADELPDVPTHVVSFGPVGLCDVLTCTPHVNSILVRTEALRAVGCFDAGAAHFDDWSAWLRLADRGARMWSVPEVVAEWRLHDAGLSGEVLQTRVMKARILALFDRLAAELGEESVRAIAEARRVVEDNDVLTYDDYAEAMAAARRALHANGRCLGPRLTAHRSPQFSVLSPQ